MFIRTAATYQIATSANTTVATGAMRTSSGWPRKARRRGAGRAIALFVIGMPRAQAGANAMCDLEEFRRLADLQGTLARKIAVDDIDDAAGPRRHHHDPGRQEHRLGNRVGDEQHGLGGLVPQLQQLLVE